MKILLDIDGVIADIVGASFFIDDSASNVFRWQKAQSKRGVCFVQPWSENRVHAAEVASYWELVDHVKEIKDESRL
jgi:hypothetical protein